MLNLRRLRSFVAVAEELNFRRAAGRLGLSQPPLSRHIKDLEAEVGTLLIQRDNRHVVLTEAGHALLIRARSLLAHADDVMRQVRAQQAPSVGRITIGYVPSAACQVLPIVLPELRRRHPELKVLLREMTADEQIDALLGERLDIGLMRLPVPHPRLMSEVLTEEPFVAALAESHPLAALPAIPASALNAQPLVGFPARAFGAGLHLPIVAFLENAGVNPSAILEVNSLQSAVGLASAGAALAIVPQSMMLFRLPGLVFRQFRDPRPTALLGMVWRATDFHKQVREAFFEAAHELRRK